MRWLLLIAASTPALFAQLAPPNPSGVSIGHVHIIVSDPPAQKHLWVDVLGAQVTATGTLELLRLPGIFIVLGKARTEPTGGSDGSTVNHFSFLVKSYAETRAKLTGASVPLVSDNASAKTFIADFPEKVRVEFTEDTALTVPLQFQRMLIASADPDKLRDW
jgi:catechol 2,3-dioxygenase-like lactoylglutathione lyase family enzyme